MLQVAIGIRYCWHVLLVWQGSPSRTRPFPPQHLGWQPAWMLWWIGPVLLCCTCNPAMPGTNETLAYLKRRRQQERIREYLVDYQTHMTHQKVRRFRSCIVWATVGLVWSTAAYLVAHAVSQHSPAPPPSSHHVESLRHLIL